MSCSNVKQLKTIYSETVKSLNTLESSTESLISEKLILFSYGDAFNPNSDFTDKITYNGYIGLEYVKRGSTVILDTPTHIGNYPTNSTFSDVGYGLGYDPVVNLLNANTAIQQSEISFFPRLLSGSPYHWGLEYNHFDEVEIIIKISYINTSEKLPPTIVLYYRIYLNRTTGEFTDSYGNNGLDWGDEKPFYIHIPV